MILKSFSYTEDAGQPKFWKLENIDLNSINLIVGKNACGKTRTLNVIAALSNLLLNIRVPYRNGDFSATFENEQRQEISYTVSIEKSCVVRESLDINGENFIHREKDGSGEIKNIFLNQKTKFKVPNNVLVSTRRDDIQYPYLNDLYLWASQLRHFRFAQDAERHSFAITRQNDVEDDFVDIRETNKSMLFFKKGKKEFPKEFINNVTQDLNDIGYDIESVDLNAQNSIQLQSPVQAKLIGLVIKERDCAAFTDQNSMSDGLFRALSILIHFNYYELAKKSGCVLIDDIGEGLDFERSSKLIKLLISKARKIGIQLIMSTNDKFVMNGTDLDYWQVISRHGSSVSVFNKRNSPKIFEDFRFIGLNNFDFFATDFFKTGLVDV